MKKYLFALAAMIALCVAASAQWTYETPALPPQPITGVLDTLSSTGTVSSIAISSDPATSVVISTGAMYRQICLQNLSTSYALYCGDNVSVSSVPTSNLFGTSLAVATSTTALTVPLCFPIKAGTDFWCRTGSVNMTQRASVQRRR